MDWKDLAGTLIRAGAPIIGTALGGPLGGTIGGVAGKIIADALGVEATPEAVETAIRTDPAGASAALSNADAQWQALAEMAKADAADRTAQSQAINETIRDEVGKVSKWHWRNTIGHLVILYGLQQITLLFVAAFFPKVLAPADFVLLVNATVVFTGGLFALLGYVASDTTDRYKTAITGDRGSGGMVENIIKAVKPAPKKPTVIGKPVGSRD